jgi:putative oxidoreductase
MSQKIKSISMVIARLVLGLIFVIFGLNYFLQFLPMPPQSGGAAESFTTGLFLSGYFFPFLKALEVLIGIALLARLLVPLVLVVLMPITINILLFHLFLTDSVVMSVIILGLHLYLAWGYRDHYVPLLTAKGLVRL